MNGPIPAMYSIKPIIQFSGGIVLPTNMYKMKSIYSDFHENKPDGIERNEHNIEEISSDPIIEDIENRQSLILEQLKELQNQMDLLRKQLVQSTPSSPKKDSSKYSTHAVKKTCKPVFSENGLLGDVVINADPNYPPYSLLGVKKIWSDSINLKISSYVHSSIVDLPNKDKLSVFSSSNSDCPADVPTLNVTLVWKNIGPDCEFVVSPLKNCTISGEVNVLRYIHRQLNPDSDIVEETKLDGFLDTCYCLIHASTQKEKQSIIRKLNATLGKSDWFGGSSVSVSDLAAWSTVRNVNNLELVQKLSKWMEQCNQHIGQDRIVQMRNHKQDNEPINMRSNRKPSVKNSLETNTVKSSVVYSTSNPVVVKKPAPFSASPVLQCKPIVSNEIVDTDAVSKSAFNTKQSHLNSNKRKRKFPPQKLSLFRKNGGSSDGCSKKVTKYQQNFNNFQQLKPQHFMAYNYDKHGRSIQKIYPSSFSHDYFYLPSSQVLPYKNSPPSQTLMNRNFTDYRFLYQKNFDSYSCNHFDVGNKFNVQTFPKVIQPKKLSQQSNRRKIRYPFRNIYWSRKCGNNTSSFKKKVVTYQGNINNYFQEHKPILPLMHYNYENYGEIKNPGSYSSLSACSSSNRPRFNGTPYNNLPFQINYNTYGYNHYYQYEAGSCNSFDPVKPYFEFNQSNNGHYDNYNYDGSHFYHNPNVESFSYQSLFSRSPLVGPPMRGSKQKNISHKGVKAS